MPGVSALYAEWGPSPRTSFKLDALLAVDGVTGRDPTTDPTDSLMVLSTKTRTSRKTVIQLAEVVSYNSYDCIHDSSVS